MNESIAEKQRNRTKARNAAFRALSKPEKRVAIAKDVLAQLRAKRLIAMAGTYVERADGDDFWHTGTSVKTEIADVLEQAPACTVCALGSAFVCAVRLNDKLAIKDIADPDYHDGKVTEWGRNAFGNREVYAYLGKFFPKRQLTLMESAFERDCLDDAHWDNEILPSDMSRAVVFGEQYENDGKRLAAIMRNIIKHDGQFVP